MLRTSLSSCSTSLRVMGGKVRSGLAATAADGEVGVQCSLVTNLVTNLSPNLVTNLVITKFGDKFGDEFGDKFSEHPI